MSLRSDEQDARSQLRKLGEYLILAASGPGDVVDALAHLAVPLKTNANSSAERNDFHELIKIAQHEYSQRSRRSNFFNTDLFGEPAWDILLDLFISKATKTRVSITSACIAAQVPQTTALRWIGLLEAEGLIIRIPDTNDHRRVWIELSQLAVNEMIKYLNGNNNAGLYTIENMEVITLKQI